MSIEAKPGDLFACVHRGSITKVVIERVTTRWAVDTKGGRWLLRNGARVGDASEWHRRSIVPWTADHDRKLSEQREWNTFNKALESLATVRHNAINGGDGMAALRRALPHVRAAVAALQEPTTEGGE